MFLKLQNLNEFHSDFVLMQIRHLVSDKPLNIANLSRVEFVFKRTPFLYS